MQGWMSWRISSVTSWDLPAALHEHATKIHVRANSLGKQLRSLSFAKNECNRNGRHGTALMSLFSAITPAKNRASWAFP